MSRDRIALGDRVLDLGWGTVERGDVLERLSPSECRVLRTLAARAGEVVTRAALAESLGRAVGDNALDRLMSRLRARLEVDPARPRHLRTARGAGYCLVAGDAPPAQPRAAHTSLVGRSEDLARLTALPDRLVVITGFAGVGKTTLARALLARVSGWFVDLASAHTDAEVAAEVAAALAVDVVEVGARLASLDAPLVVLDNAERCGNAVARCVEGWRRAAGRARFVATSRRPLGVPDEHRVHLAPLAAPDAAALLQLRAVEADPLVALDPATADRIVRCTEGVPLILELAAAYLDRMSPAELADRLERSLAWLEDPRADRPERQSTLGRALDWSWALLGPAEQAALATWSMFLGSFALADADALVPDALDPLQHLAEVSLVRILAGPRFVLPDAVRSYAADRLAERPDHAAVAATWRRWCAEGAGTGPERERVWSFAAALDADPDGPEAPALALHLLGHGVGLDPARRMALADYADRATGLTAVRLRAARCRVRRYAGLPGYAADLDRALAIATELGDPRATAEVRFERARLREDDGDIAGAEQDLLALPDAPRSRYLLACLYAGAARPRAAEAWFRWVRERGERPMALRAEMHLAVLASRVDPAAAEATLEALGAALDPSESSEAAIAPFLRAWRAMVRWERGDLPGAAALAADAVAELRARSWIVPATEIDATSALLRPALDEARAHLDRVRLVGVAVSNLEPLPPQLGLPFDGGPRPPDARPSGLSRAVDAVRDRFGYDAIRLGTTGSTSWLA